MSIFEDKKHNNGKYVGQVPVLSVPEDITRKTRVVYAVNGRDNYPWPHSVRHVPDPMPNVFPGNPGPEPIKLNARWQPPSADQIAKDRTRTTLNRALDVRADVIPISGEKK